MANSMIQTISLINFECYVDGNRYIGSASVDLPEISYLTSETSGAGIAGKIDTPILGHTENLEVTLHWRTIFANPIQLLDNDGVMLTLRGAMQEYDASNGKQKVLAVKITLRAMAAGMTLGKLEPGEQTDTESKLNCDYIKIEIDGVRYFEHDTFNFVHYVKSRDLLKEVKTALGL